jgi:hypothetical protein
MRAASASSHNKALKNVDVTKRRLLIPLVQPPESMYACRPNDVRLENLFKRNKQSRPNSHLSESKQPNEK